MTRCGPSPDPAEACWSPSLNIRGGGNTFLLGTHFLTGSLSLFFQYWAFSDIQTGRVLTKVTDETSGCCKLS